MAIVTYKCGYSGQDKVISITDSMQTRRKTAESLYSHTHMTLNDRKEINAENHSALMAQTELPGTADGYFSNLFVYSSISNV
jgi:hypothetical protein